MRYRPFNRALGFVLAIGLLSAGSALADSARVDGNTDTVEVDNLVELGPVAPGAVIVFDVGFQLHCSGFFHVNADQSVVLTPGPRTVPPGAAASYTAATLGPAGEAWPDDADSCPPEIAPVVGAAGAEVTITAPLAPGEGYLYTLMWNRALSPAAPGDFGTLSGATAVSVTLDVVSNTPPTLVLPASVTLEGHTAGGALAAYTAGATDAEDDPDPTPVCTPAVGEVIGLGTTTVHCAVTDSGGLRVSGSFPLTVEDTTPPSLTGLPDGLLLATGNRDGATLAYALPVATDVVDPNPKVACTQAPGEVAPVGASTVTCTATDGSGNSTSASFEVRVQLWTASWDEPVGDGQFTANAGRTVPVKVRLFLDGAELTSGSPVLRVDRCDGTGPTLNGPLEWGSGNGRWNGHIDTSRLGPTGCHRIGVIVDGVRVVSVGMEVVGSLAPATNQAKSRVR
jgi:hypothetical protein